MKRVLIQIISYSISLILLILISVKIYNHFSVKRFVTKPISKKGSDIIFGNKDAKESIYLFGNYQCSHCKYFFKEDYPKLKKEILDSGKINLRVRFVPLSDNKSTLNVYSMSISIFKYGEYEKFHNMLLHNFNLAFTPEYEDLINNIMQDNEAIAQDYLSENNIADLENNRKEFKELKFKGTPTIIFRNRIYKGRPSIKELKQQLEIN